MGKSKKKSEVNQISSSPDKSEKMDISNASINSKKEKKKAKRLSHSRSEDTLPTPKTPSTPKENFQSSTPLKPKPMEISVDSVDSIKKKKRRKHNSLNQSADVVSTHMTPSTAKQKTTEEILTNSSRIENGEKSEEVLQAIESSESDAGADMSGHYILLGKIQDVTDENKMRSFLNENEIEVDELRWVSNLPMGIVSFDSDSQLNEVTSKLENMSENSQKLGWAILKGNVKPFLVKKQQQSQSSIFVSHLPPNISKSDFEEHLPSTIVPGSWSFVFIHSNRNSSNNIIAAKLTFSSITDARTAIAALNKCKISGSRLKASVFVERDRHKKLDTSIKSSNPQSSSDSQNQHCTLLIGNLPSTTDYRRMKDLFPTASKFDLKKRSASKNRCFVEFPDSQTCRDALQSIQGTILDGNELTAVSVPAKKRQEKTQNEPVELGTALKVTNIPFSYTRSQVAEEFPTASRVYLVMKNSSKNAGSAFLKFNSTGDCRAVFDACKAKKLNERQVRCIPVKALPEVTPEANKRKSQTKPKEANLHVLRVSNAPYSVTEKDMKAYFPDALKIELQKGETGTSKGIFLISFADLAVCQASQKSIVGTKVSGRALRSEIIRNETKEQDFEDPAASQSEPKAKKGRIEDSLHKEKEKGATKKSELKNKNSDKAETTDSSESSD